MAPVGRYLAVALLLGGCSPQASPSAHETSTSEGRDDQQEPASGSSQGADTQADEDGGGFVPSDPGEYCETYDLDSCPPRQKCAPASSEPGAWWDIAHCVPLVDEQQEGEGCYVLDREAGIDTCDKGLMCWDPDPDTNVGMCVEMCTGDQYWSDGDGCSGDKLCNSDKNGILNLCLDTCTPLDDQCPVGCVCMPSSDHPAFWCGTQWQGALPKGSPCQYANACESGLGCLNAELVHCDEENAASCCAAFCDLEAESPCDGADEVCVPYHNPESENLDDLAVNVGFCAIGSGDTQP